MGFLVSAFGLAIVVIGLLGLVSPDALLPFVRRWQTWPGVWTAAALRVGFGAALWLAAPSRTPVALQVPGVESVSGGPAATGRLRFAAIVVWSRDDRRPSGEYGRGRGRGRRFRALVGERVAQRKSKTPPPRRRAGWWGQPVCREMQPQAD
jgi:hypothetical protein